MTRNQNKLEITQTREDSRSTGLRRLRTRDEGIGLLVLWNADEPNTLGAFLPISNGTQTYVLGRGASQLDNAEYARVELVRQRPNRNEQLPPFESPSLSRTQLLIRAESQQCLELTNAGRRRLFVNGTATESHCVSPGDIVELGAQLTMLCVTRPCQFELHPGTIAHEFGEPDACGLVGESAPVWKLRREIAHVARRSGHVLLAGNVGTGKHLSASAIHMLSGREGPFVACNARAVPRRSALAEIFGNVQGYPNPREPERMGLLRAAHNGTLYLDGFTALPASTQSDVSRALTAGEYRRLGEDTLRRCNIRLIAASDRPAPSLRPDVAARFEFRLQTPRLEERREDIPLLVYHILCSMQSEDESLSRLFTRSGLPQFDTGFMRKLVRHPWTAHIHELRDLLHAAVASSHGDRLQWPDQPLPVYSDFAPNHEIEGDDPTTRDSSREKL